MEFCWRNQASDDQYQMVTWSRDRTMRIWPIGKKVRDLCEPLTIIGWLDKVLDLQLLKFNFVTASGNDDDDDPISLDIPPSTESTVEESSVSRPESGVMVASSGVDKESVTTSSDPALAVEAADIDADDLEDLNVANSSGIKSSEPVGINKTFHVRIKNCSW